MSYGGIYEPWIVGIVYDGAGEPVSDAMVETWQANGAGRYNDLKDERQALPLDPETFSGFGRSGTDTGGRFSFVTVKPGPAEGMHAPHIMVSVLILSVTAAASVRRVQDLVPTLQSAMVQEHERAAGAWHSEWEALSEALALTGGGCSLRSDGRFGGPSREDASVREER